MREDTFEEILRCVRLPLGELLNDGSTYRVTSKDFRKINTRHKAELRNFDKFLVLSCDQENVVGGVLFYGSTDIQVTVFPQYRGQHFMSRIHKNGILKSECYPDQRVSISTKTIDSFADFQKKHYLLSCAGLKISNLSEIYKYFNMFKFCDNLSGFQKCSEEEFLKVFS